MAGNAHISKRIIASLASHPSGRASLCLGCLRWQTKSTGVSSQQGTKSAAQWAVTRLWQLGAPSKSTSLNTQIYKHMLTPDKVRKSMTPTTFHKSWWAVVGHLPFAAQLTGWASALYQTSTCGQHVHPPLLCLRHKASPDCFLFCGLFSMHASPALVPGCQNSQLS